MNTQLVPIEGKQITTLPLFCYSLELSHLCVGLQIYFMFFFLGGGTLTKLTLLLSNDFFFVRTQLELFTPSRELLLSSVTIPGLYFYLMTGPEETLGPDAGALLRLRSAD